MSLTNFKFQFCYEWKKRAVDSKFEFLRFEKNVNGVYSVRWKHVRSTHSKYYEHKSRHFAVMKISISQKEFCRVNFENWVELRCDCSTRMILWLLNVLHFHFNLFVSHPFVGQSRSAFSQLCTRIRLKNFPFAKRKKKTLQS